jgi:hypothetical protein
VSILAPARKDRPAASRSIGARAVAASAAGAGEDARDRHGH